MHAYPVTEAQLDAYLASLPPDDEEPTAAELAAVEEGRRAAAAGEFASPEEVAALVA